MSQPQSSEILARWRCEPQLWQDFVEYDSSVYTKSIRSAKIFIIATVVGTILLTAALGTIPYLVTGKFGPDSFWPALFIFVFGLFCIAVGVVVIKMRHQKLAALKSSNGEVFISSNGLGMGNVVFNWHFENDAYGWSFVDGARITVSPQPGMKFEVLELKFEAYIPGKNVPHRESATWRVPVPPGKEFEADAVLERLRSISLANLE
jgi:NOL1/NOP2/fmu family ribosome biogenesis protein